MLYTSNRSMSSLYNLRYQRQTVGDIQYEVLRFSKGDGDIVLEENLPREAIVGLCLNPKSHQLTKFVLLSRVKFVVMYVSTFSFFFNDMNCYPWKRMVLKKEINVSIYLDTNGWFYNYSLDCEN